MSDAPATCGAGLAAHAPLPDTIGALFEALGALLDAHQQALDLADENARPEHHAYLTLVHELRAAAAQLKSIAARMRGYSDLPMGRHDMQQLAGAGFRNAFASYVDVERDVLGLLTRTVGEHEAMLAQMSDTGE